MTRQELLEIAKPLLLNTEMVRATLDGRKTATRRAVKSKNILDYPIHRKDMLMEWKIIDFDSRQCVKIVKPPYKAGDILYVQETWAVENTYKNIGVYGFDIVYKSDNKILDCMFDDIDRYIKFSKFESKNGWQSPYFMPKEAARLLLRVTDVRPERLQDITTEDICIEGVWVEPPSIVKGVKFPDGFEKRTDSEKENWYKETAQATYIGQCTHVEMLHRAWESLWNSTIKKADLATYGWNANPWVWVIEFERINYDD